MRPVAFVVVLALGACGPSASDPLDGGGPDSVVTPQPDAGPRPDNTAIFAHSATELFRVDPDTLIQTSVGDFSFADEPENITDIAVNKDGVMVAISLNSVYSVDLFNAETTLLSQFADGEGGLTSLSFVLQDQNDPDSEKLVAADFDGNVWEIATASGARVFLGNYNGAGGTGVGSSGDIVSIRSFGTIATVNVDGEANDFLAWIDPQTWETTLIGDTGHDRIFGLGFWENKVYGFTDNMEFVTIDPQTGAPTATQSSAISWWGAGVTTLAPIID